MNFKTKTTILRLTVIGFCLHFAQVAVSDGTLIGNGGDAVSCTPSPHSPFEGLYVLDYLLEYRSQGQRANLAPVNSWELSRQRIVAELSRLAPALGNSFDEFSQYALKPQPHRGRRWQKHPLTHIDIRDEEILRLLPPNCYSVSTDKRPSLHQAVVRSYLSPLVVYHFDPEVISILQSERPLQFSFLMVHEWLWDFTENVSALRKLNWLLHSSQLNEFDPKDLSDFFQHHRFFDREIPLCQRSPAIQSRIEAQLKNDCSKIEITEFRNLQRLDMTSLKLDENLWPGDFSGFYGLRELDLSKSHKILERLSFRGFESLINLRKLSLNSTSTKSVPHFVPDNLPSLEELDLRNNPLNALPSHFSRFARLQILSMTVGPQFDFASFNDSLPYSFRTLRLNCSSPLDPGARESLKKAVSPYVSIALDKNSCGDQ